MEKPMEPAKLAEIINRAHDELVEIVPQVDQDAPGGERSRASTYVHQHMRIMAGGLEGYGFEDSALTDGQMKIANLSETDRVDWMGSGHDATSKGAAWIAPHLSRTTIEYFHDRTQCEQALRHLPRPKMTVGSHEDIEVMAVIGQHEGRRYIVPLPSPGSGTIHEARPLTGLGAGLVNAQDIDQALIGHGEDSYVETRCTMRPMNQSPGGPVMIVGMEWQTAASSLHEEIGRNAVDRFELIHERRPEVDGVVSIALQSGIRTVDRIEPTRTRTNAWMDQGTPDGYGL